MKRWHAVIMGVAVGCVLCGTTRAWAGVVMVSEHSSGERGAAGMSTLYVQGDQMRMESPGGASVALYDGERQRFVALDIQQHRYTEMTPAQIQAAQLQVQKALEQMKAQMEQMKSQLAQLPPEQRKMVEKMMAQQSGTAMPPPAQPTFAKVGSETIGHWNADHYVGTVNGKKHAEAWMAAEATLGVRAEDLAVLKSYRQHFVTPMSQSTPTSLYGNGIGELPGVPVKTVQYDEQGQVKQTTLLKTVEQRTLEPSLFAIPAGFTLQTLPPMPAAR
ncbi:MAG: DUF4412 domain-containing protein [Deltaproteobacteria bacterium]|nr:DUF4412 domain-containing protein [Deltaproteobacteria bacterium]